MKKILLVFCVLFIGTILFAIDSMDSIEKVDNSGSYINWSTNEYVAVGVGSVAPASKEPDRGIAEKKAERYAELEALRKLSMLINGTSITSTVETKDFVSENEIITIVMSGQLKGVQTSKPEYFTERNIEKVRVICTIPIIQATKPIIQQVFKKEAEIFNNIDVNSIKQPKVEMKTNAKIVMAPVEKFPVKIKEPKANQVNANINVKAQVAARSINNPYTGVIFDATDFRLSRALSPKIRLSNGDVVWCGANVEFDYFQDGGLVSYLGSLKSAKKSKRAGVNPLIIKAVNIAGDIANCDIIISEQDAGVLKDENTVSEFLDKLNIIIVCEYYK